VTAAADLLQAGFLLSNQQHQNYNSYTKGQSNLVKCSITQTGGQGRPIKTMQFKSITDLNHDLNPLIFCQKNQAI